MSENNKKRKYTIETIKEHFQNMNHYYVCQKDALEDKLESLKKETKAVQDQIQELEELTYTINNIAELNADIWFYSNLFEDETYGNSNNNKKKNKKKKKIK